MNHLAHCLVLSICVAASIAVTQAPSQAPAVLAYGNPTPGTGGLAPDLWVSSTPRPGNAAFALQVRSGLANANSVTFLSLNQASFVLQGVAVNIDFNASLQLSPAQLDAKGALDIPLGIPNQASLIGARVVAQTFVADTGGAPLGFSGSRGLALRLEASAALIGAGTALSHIDLGTGTVTKFGLFFGSTYDPSITADGQHVAIAHSSPHGASLFDIDGKPPQAAASSYTAPNPLHLPQWGTMHPDGVRYYVVNNGPANSNPVVEAVWALPANFGTLFNANSSIPMGAVIDPIDILFSPEGKLGYLGTLGLFGGGAQVRVLDVDPASPTFHQQVTSNQWVGHFMFTFALSPAGDKMAVPVAPLGNNTVVHLVIPQTLTNLRTLTGLPLGRVVEHAVFGPRGRHLYLANGNHVLRVIVDLADPQFGTFDKFDAGISSSANVHSSVLTDAGDRLYVATDAGTVYEYDVTSRAMLRSFPNTGARHLACR